MLAQSDLDLGKNKNRLSEILIDFEASRLYRAFSAFSTELKKQGYSVEIYSIKSLELYPELSETRKNELSEYYENWLSWIQLSDIEIEFAKRSLNHFGLHIDENFWLTYTDEQVKTTVKLNHFWPVNFNNLLISVRQPKIFINV